MTIQQEVHITVFMAAYNAEAYIATSIQSVLIQTYPHFELLIVDDGSTDRTVEIVNTFSDPRIRLIQNKENRGLPYTRNVALTEAKGELMAILDSDDISFSNRLQLQIEEFRKRPELAVLGGFAYIINKQGERTGEEITLRTGVDKTRAILLFANTFVHSTVMIRMSAFKDIGGYPNHTVAQDYALFARIALKYEVDNLPTYLGEYRIHDNNITDRKKHLTENQLRMILLEQLLLLIPNTAQKSLDILRTPIHESKYSIASYYRVYREIILQNRQKKQYPIRELERLLHENWYEIVMAKGKWKTFILFLRKPVFNATWVTSKQLRRVLKRSIRQLFS